MAPSCTVPAVLVVSYGVGFDGVGFEGADETLVGALTVLSREPALLVGPVSAGAEPLSSSLALMSLAIEKKASSTFVGVFAEVSINLMPNSFANASPLSGAILCASEIAQNCDAYPRFYIIALVAHQELRDRLCGVLFDIFHPHTNI